MAVFYYDLSSPYAYLAAERVEEVLAPVHWQPIAFGPLIVEIGKVPWSLTPGEREAGVAEIEARAAARGLPPVRWPEGWPAESYSVLAPRAALWAEREGAQHALAMALFRRMFVAGEALDRVETVLDCAREAGLDADALAAALGGEELKRELREATAAAIARGVTGVPTVAVGEQLFWGDDHLEDAASIPR